MSQDTETRTQERPWRCEKCGIGHTHYRGYEHSLTGLAPGPHFWTMDFEYNLDCHCGWHEAAERIKGEDLQLPSEISTWIVKMQQKLLLPEDVKKEIEQKYGP